MEGVPLVACITDFGTEDYYAGAVRGVLSGGAARGSVVDITHEVPAGDVRRAGLLLWEAQPSFPKGTIFLVVVDPGVGSERRAAIFRFPDCDVICPDNGTATFLLERFAEFQAAEILPDRIGLLPPSNTFQGRDLFAPAALQLAGGRALSSFGPRLDSPQRLPLPRLESRPAGGWEGEALYCDHFGNIITSIGRISSDFGELTPWIQTGARGGKIHPAAYVELSDGSRIPKGRTYADASSGPGRIALVGSNGLLEIASWRSAAGIPDTLKPGSLVRLVSPA